MGTKNQNYLLPLSYLHCHSSNIRSDEAHDKLDERQTGPKYSPLVPHINDPNFLPRYSVPESNAAKKDSSTSRQMLIIIDFASLFAMPNSTLSNLVIFFKKVPLTDNPGLESRLSWCLNSYFTSRTLILPAFPLELTHMNLASGVMSSRNLDSQGSRQIGHPKATG